MDVSFLSQVFSSLFFFLSLVVYSGNFHWKYNLVSDGKFFFFSGFPNSRASGILHVVFLTRDYIRYLWMIIFR